MFKPFLSEELWLSDARLRTEHYNQLVKSGSPLPSVEWVLVESGAPIPDNAIQCGHEKHGQRQFACRAFIKNGVHCGKYCEVSLSLKQGGKPLIGHGNKEVSPAVFEILVGFPLAVEWIDCSESLSHCDSVYKGHHLIIGGNDGDKPFYVGQSHHEKGVHIGKVSDKMLLPFGNREHVKKSFRVLAYH